MEAIATEVSEWSAEDLLGRLEAGEDLFLLDIRDDEEFERWKIEGTKEIPALNVPIYEFLAEDEHDDAVDTFRAYVERELVDRLPRGTPILTVCPEGDASSYLAEALRRLDLTAFNLAGGMEAWGNHYRSRNVVRLPELQIWQLSRPARGCLSYVAASGGEAVVVDPLRHVDHYLELARKLGFEIVRVVDTHGHADHISGGPRLAAELGVPYHLHPYDAIHPIDVLPARIAYEPLREGQELSFGRRRLRCVHIPGHTLGNLALYLDDGFLFSGDSIFIESIARPDLGGRGETWAPLHYRSLLRLLDLPADTVVLPGHFSQLGEGSEGLWAASLGELAEANEGLVMARKGEDEFVRYILSSLPNFPDEYVEIKRVNAGLVEVDESQASELELGKNICALSSKS